MGEAYQAERARRKPPDDDVMRCGDRLIRTSMFEELEKEGS